MKFKLLLVLSLVLVLLAGSFTVAFAQDEQPPVVTEPSPPEPTNPSLPDVAVLIAIVAFFKKRLDLKENGVVYAAVITGAVLWFSPLIAEMAPAAAVWINQFLAFVKWILASMGTVDFLINTGAKIATATPKSVN